MKVIKETMYVDQLKRHVTMYVGLPDNYETENKDYPVLYMHDAQNVFLKEDSSYGMCWRVIETYAQDDTLPDIIIVGLDSAKNGRRLDEYCPYTFTYQDKSYGGQANRYLSYIVNDLKPNIDKIYRTKKAVNAMMGASMGGNISLYAAMTYPNIFNRVASLSGAFHAAKDQLLDELKKRDLSTLSKVYLDTGDEEVAGGGPEDYLLANHDVYEIISQTLPPNKVQFRIITGGKHNEDYWAKRFPDVVKYLFS